MAKVITLGKMAEATKDNTTTIRNTDMASIPGLMAEDMRDIGKMEKDKEEANMYYQVE